MGAMVLLTAQDGDRRIPWDPHDPDQVKGAHEQFNRLIGEGYRAYRMGRAGQPGERIAEFDPLAGEIMFTAKHGYQGG